MNLTLLESPDWKDYELLDSGDGLKLERFGAYRFCASRSAGDLETRPARSGLARGARGFPADQRR